MKGIIALDIDGTITIDMNDVKHEVARFLESLSSDGWSLIFITGRTFLWGNKALEVLQCPYHLAVQNGAIVLQMPARKIVTKKYIDRSIVDRVESMQLGEPCDVILYSGFENQDICYFRPHKFTDELLGYLSKRIDAFGETWLPVANFDEVPVQEYASIKWIGPLDVITRISREVESVLGLHIPVIRDPFDSNYFVAQATHPAVSKGYALRDFSKLFPLPFKVIAAGDDFNDRSMLECAQVKVVMATAPEELLAMADIIAPPAAESGIIAGLKQAIEFIKG